MPQARAFPSLSPPRAMRPPVSKREAKRASFDRNRPLVLDLDGTLVRRSLLLEGIASLLRRNALMLFPLIAWSLQGKAVLRKRVAERATLDITRLMVNHALVAYARAERAQGREIALVTALDERIARRVARRFDFIDRVITSDDSGDDLRGDRRAEKLREIFPNGFHYAGNSHLDLPVWRTADHVIVAEAARSVLRQVFFLGRPIKQLAAAR